MRAHDKDGQKRGLRICTKLAFGILGGSTESMNIIPSFQKNGELPQGRYLATSTEFESRFVDTFPLSLTRRRLFDGWATRRQRMSELVRIEYEWIDGSFVTGKRDPNDIDLVTFIDANTFEALDQADREKLTALAQGAYPRVEFSCDCYLVLISPEGHSDHITYLVNRGYWDHFWSRNRDKNQKGYIMIGGEE